MNLDPVRDDEKISNPDVKQEGGEGEADESGEKTAPSEASTSSTPGNPSKSILKLSRPLMI